MYFKEVQGILNWCPLTSVTRDIDDFRCLSPMSILNSGIHPAVPAEQIIKADRIREWKASQHMAQDFWKDWLKIYLPMLTPHKKWFVPKKNFAIGNLVLLRESNLVDNQCSKARITKVFPNRDGKVRCVELVRPDKAVYLKDIRNLCRLECNAYNS